MESKTWRVKETKKKDGGYGGGDGGGAVAGVGLCYDSLSVESYFFVFSKSTFFSILCLCCFRYSFHGQ